MNREFIAIGEIVNTQGNRGAVRVIPLTDFPERFTGMKSVSVKTGDIRKEYRIEQLYHHKKYVIIKFDGINSIGEGKALKGGLLQVTRDQLVPLPEGSYYVFDLVGLPVYTLEGEYLGEIRDILKTGANDVFVVEGEGEKAVLIPALKQLVKMIDLKGRCVKVDPPEGLL